MDPREHPVSSQTLRRWMEEAGRPVGLDYLVAMHLESTGRERSQVKIYDPRCDFVVGDRVYVPKAQGEGWVVQKQVQPEKPWDFIWIRFPLDWEGGGRGGSGGVSRYWICNRDRTGAQPQVKSTRGAAAPATEQDQALARTRVEQALLRDGQFISWGEEWYLADRLPPLPDDLPERAAARLRAARRAQRTEELVEAVLGTRPAPDDPAYLLLQFAVNVRLAGAADAGIVCVSHFDGGVWDLRQRVERLFAVVPERFRLPRVRSELLREVVYLQPDHYEDDLKPLAEEPPASARAATLRRVLSYGEFVTGTLQLPPSQRGFFPAVVQLTFVDQRTGEPFTVHYNRDTGCVVGLQDWYYENLLVPGAILRIHRTGRPGSFALEVRDGGQQITYRRLVYDAAADEVRQVDETYVTTCEVDPMAFIEQQRLGQIELLRRQARPGTNLYDLTVRVFQEFGSPLHALRVYHLVDAVRKTTRASIWAILSSYACFEQRPEERGTGLYRLNPAKVGIRTIKTRVRDKVRVPVTEPEGAGGTGAGAGSGAGAGAGAGADAGAGAGADAGPAAGTGAGAGAGAGIEAEAAGARAHWLLVLPGDAPPDGANVARRGCRPGDRVLIAREAPPAFLGTARVGASGALTGVALWPEPLPAREVASDLEMITNPELPLASYFEPGVRPLSAFDYDLARALGAAPPRTPDADRPPAAATVSDGLGTFAFPPEKKYHLLHNVTIPEELDHLLGVVAALPDPFTLDQALAAALVAQVSDGRFAEFHAGMYRNLTDEAPPDSSSLLKKLRGRARPFWEARRERFRRFRADPAAQVDEILRGEYKPGAPLRRYWVEYIRDYVDFAAYTGLIYRPSSATGYRKTALLRAYVAGQINRYDLLGLFKFRNIAIDYQALDQYDVEVRPFVAGLRLLAEVGRPIPKDWLGCLISALKAEHEVGGAAALAARWLETNTGPDEESLAEGRRGFRFLRALLGDLVEVEGGRVAIRDEGRAFLRGVPGRALFCGQTVHGLPLNGDLAFVLGVLTDRVKAGEREIPVELFTRAGMPEGGVRALLDAVQSWPDPPIEGVQGARIRLAGLERQYQVNPYTDLLLPRDIARFEELRSRWSGLS